VPFGLLKRRPFPARAIILIAILGQLSEVIRLEVVRMHHVLLIPLPVPGKPARDGTPQTPAVAPAMAAVLLAAPARLHAPARAERAEAVDGDAVDLVVFAAGVSFAADAEFDAFRVLAREVEEVDAGEDGEEAAEEGDGVDCVGGVEALEEDEGGAEGAGGEGYVVEGVDTKGE